MTISVRATSAVAVGTTDLSIAMPTGTVENDIMLMLVCVNDLSSVGSLPAGWTRFAQTQGPTITGFFAWKRAASGEAGPYAVSGFADSCSGVITSLPGCVTSGDPIDVYASRVNSGNSNGTDGITPTVSGAMIVLGAAVQSNLSGASGWSATNPPASAFTERADGGTNNGNDSHVALATGLQSGYMGFTGATYNAQSYGCECIGFAIALKPVDAAPKIGAVGLTSLYRTDAKPFIGGVGLTTLYKTNVKPFIGGAGLTVLYSTEVKMKVGAMGLTVLYREMPPVGHRTFPLPQGETRWQNQANKRKFPMPGMQIQE